jgi:hypothetical protein
LATASFNVEIGAQFEVETQAAATTLATSAKDADTGGVLATSIFAAFKAAAQADAAFNTKMGGDGYNWTTAETAFKEDFTATAPAVGGGPSAGTTSSANSFAVVGAFAAVMAGVLA